MVENSSDKKRNIYTIILLLTFVFTLIGASLAYYRLVASQKEKSTKLYSGTLSITYLDGTYIKNPELFPMKDVTYDSYQNVYRNNFSVSSTGTLDQTILIDLIMSSNTFNENALKYALYNSKGNRLATGYVPTTGKVNLVSNIFLGHGETAKYTLIIWWNDTGYDQTKEIENETESETESETKGESTISGQISVTAKQIKY